MGLGGRQSPKIQTVVDGSWPGITHSLRVVPLDDYDVDDVGNGSDEDSEEE
jgi:hypothetical protein